MASTARQSHSQETLRTRRELKRDLKKHVARLLPHLDHLSDGDYRALDLIADDLEAIHVNDTVCKRLCTMNGRSYVPQGTRHAPWWERAWYRLRPAER
jgi:hypothetical protein